ncbi:MAG: tandem-95 repeat protein [Planctomycetota bacterium]|nr:tandem-95 repeat protein [Planctomycetota bacterium]
MRQPKPKKRTRPRRSWFAPSRSFDRRRPLQIESLEERTLLAGLAEGEGPNPLLAVRLNAVNPHTLEPLEAVHQGEEFVLLASVEDLRHDASGVFGAYLDVLYPSSFFSVPDDAGQAALVYASGFGNGRSGDVLTGQVDELGTFATDTNPPGPGEQLLAGIRLVATHVGEAQITTNAADQSPAHDILLFDRDDPVPTELVMYGGLTLQILEPLPDVAVDAIADVRVVHENSAENLFAVLDNDKNTTGSPLVITGVDTSNSHGDVTIANHGTLLVYTPDRGFVGRDQFTYTIMADGQEDTTSVTVQVQRVVAHEDRVAYDLKITDRAGSPVSAVTVGHDFVLHVTAEDLRDVPSGVFAAYLDVHYTSGAAEVAGPITYGPSYANNQVGDASTPGEIDEVGAFSGSAPLGAGAFEVFQIPFHANSPGHVVFEANPAENDPGSQTLLYDVDAAVALEDILFGRVTLTVVPAVVAVDDTYEVQVNSATQTFAVLENDVNLGNGTLSVVAVHAAGLLGAVAVTPNGSGVTYTPAPGFGGSEQFLYTISGPAGSSTAEVTVHVQPAAALDDQLDIRLATTDLEGREISSVDAGQEFLVQAFVQDLRGPGVDHGVYAAYFDLLYERAGVHPVESTVGTTGPAIDFGSEYHNGIHTDASVPGIFNEIGAFQTATTPLGTGESLLFAARFRAAPARGEADSFQVLEDAEAELSVLENDLPNLGMTTFQADPADDVPLSDALFYDPVEAVPYGRIRYGNATIEITTGSAGSIASVSHGSAGGSISIGDQGTTLLYAPAANFNGVESFTYSIDGQSHIEVSVTVLPVNDAPVARSDSYRARENRALTVGTNIGVAANDWDVDGDQLEAVLVDGTSHGSLHLEQDGSFRYVPDEHYLGRDSFAYKLTDGHAESSVTTVEIDVVPVPVSIRLEAVGPNGEPVHQVAADESLVVRTLVQDLRSPSDVQLGIGAAYFDIVYDVDAINPTISTDGPLGLDIQFGAAYPNGIGGNVLAEGRLNDIGAFQAGFDALGGDELELFTLAFDLNGPHAANDSYTIAAGTSVNRLHVLSNEAELRWDVTLDAQYAANSPVADVAYLVPAEPVPEADIRYGDITLVVRNGALTIQSVGDSASGAAISIESNGVINYEPVEGFTGQDSFTYTVIDGQGRTATATVTLEVTESWQNPVQPTDVNGDGTDSPLDALVIINELNTVGPHDLAGGVITAFLDVNGDGVVSPIDALLVINRLIATAFLGEGESAAVGADSRELDHKFALTSPFVAIDAVASNVIPASDATLELPDRVTIQTIEVVDNAASTVPRSEFGTDSSSAAELECDEFRDLLDTIADDVGPLWTAFS